MTRRVRTLSAHRWGPHARRQTQAAREKLLGGALGDLAAADQQEADQPEPAVRREIVSSWRRSQLNGIDPGTHLTLPHDPARTGTPRLVRAGTPVLERLSEVLDNTAITLADSSSWLLLRVAADHRLLDGLDRITAAPGALLAEEVAGTNGLGTVIEVRGPVIIAGPEHYLEQMQDFTCVGVPLRDPLSGRFAGIVALTCHYRDTNEHLLPLVAEAAKEIETRLYADSTTRERALFDAFVRAARSPAVAVASLNEEYLFTNAQAAQLFEPADHALLWDWARDSMRHSRTLSGQLVLSRGTGVDIRCTTVEDETGPAGVVLTMRPTRPALAPGPAPASAPVAGPPAMPVWQQLLETGHRLLRERRRVAVLGARGAGKTTFATALHAGLPAGTRLVECDFAVDPLTAFTAVAGDPDATVLLRRVEGLAPPDALACLAHLERATARVLLAADPARVDPDLLGRLTDRTDAALSIPPLHERRQDLPGLVATLLAQLAPGRPAPRCRSDALAALLHQDLPGNCAELRRVLATALAAAGGRDIALDDLPAGYRTLTRRGRRLIALEEAERAAIVDALRQASWNAEAAAAALGISRATIYRKMRALRITRPAPH